MGGVVSTVYHAVKNAVTDFVSTTAGSIVVTVLSGIVLGPIGVIGASIFQKSLTDDKLVQLKNTIKQYIDNHQSEMNEAKELEEILQKDFFDKQVIDGIINLGKDIKANVAAVCQDQQVKIETLKNLDWAHGNKSKDFDTKGMQTKILTQTLLNLGRFALDSIAIISGIFSGDILSIGMGAFDLGMMVYTNFKGVYDNIDEIHKLQDKKKDMEKYFAAGGEFDKHMQIAVDYTVDIVRNLCTTGILWNSLINQLRAWIQMLKIVYPGAQVDLFNGLSKKLDQNPIDNKLLSQIEDLLSQVERINSDSSLGLVVKLHSLFQKVKKFEKDHQVEKIFTSIKEILTYFSSTSSLYAQITNYIKGFNDISFLIKQNAHLFQRPSLTDQDPQDKIKYDKFVLEILKKRVTVSKDVKPEYQKDIKEVKIVTIVAANTDKFYAQNPKGDTLFGYVLEPFVKNKGYMKFLDSSTSSSNSNIIEVPEPNPMNKQQYDRYVSQKLQLLNRASGDIHTIYLKKGRNSIVQFSLYMCLKTESFQIHGNKINRMVLYKAIRHNSLGVYYQQRAQNFNRLVPNMISDAQRNQRHDYDRQISEEHKKEVVKSQELHPQMKIVPFKPNQTNDDFLKSQSEQFRKMYGRYFML